MAFAVLAEREAQITQSLLLSNIFPEEIPEEIEEPSAPAIIQDTAPTPVIDQTPHTGLIAIPENTTIQVAANSTICVYSNGTHTWYTDGTVEGTRIISGRTYTSTSATSTSNVVWVPESSTTNIQTATTNGIYIVGTAPVYTHYTNAWVDGTVRGEWKKPEPKPIKRFVKNSIKRALKLLDNYGMEQDTKIFLKGDEVEVSHPDSLFKFVITKRRYNNIISLTERPGHSVPFGLELFTKCEIHVANLCVYAKDTPMLDQLFMIAMYVKSGNEEDLLRKANFSCIMHDQELKEIIVSEVDYLGPKLLPKRGGGTYINGNIGAANIVQGTLHHA